MNKREKRMLFITLILLVILISKYLFFDEVKNLNGDELKFKQFVESALQNKEEYNGFLIRSNLASYKIVKIEKIKEEGKSPIAYWAEEEKKYVEEEIQGQYRAKVRGYFLHVLPYKQFRVESALQQK